jgi:hypothetical protein
MWIVPFANKSIVFNTAKLGTTRAIESKGHGCRHSPFAASSSGPTPATTITVTGSGSGLTRQVQAGTVFTQGGPDFPILYDAALSFAGDLLRL